MKRLLKLAGLGGCTIMICILAEAACAQNRIPVEILAGGFTHASGSYRLDGTIGQTCVGRVQSSAHIVEVGGWYGVILALPVQPQSSSALPVSDQLLRNYPNPFNPLTTARLQLTRTGPVRLSVYDLLGREVARLIDGILASGAHEFSWNAGGHASGEYFLHLATVDGEQVRKITLLK